MSLQFKLVRILLDSHAEAQNVKNNDGKSPVDLAKDMNNGKVCLICITRFGETLKMSNFANLYSIVGNSKF